MPLFNFDRFKYKYIPSIELISMIPVSLSPMELAGHELVSQHGHFHPVVDATNKIWHDFLPCHGFFLCVCVFFFFVFLLEKNLWDRRPTKPTPSELVRFPSPPLQGKKKPPNYTISATVPHRFNVESGSLHTCDWGPVTIALQELSLVEKVEPGKVRFTLRLRDQ